MWNAAIRSAANAGRQAPGRRAMTLIELLIVVVLLGIAGAMVIPSMSQAGELRGQTAVRTLVADITFAQSEALAHQRRYVIVIGQIVRPDGGGGWTAEAGNGYTLYAPPAGNVDVALDADFLWDPSDPLRPVSRDLDEGSYHGAAITDFDLGTATNWIVFDELGGLVEDLTTDTAGPGGSATIQTQPNAYLVNIEGYTGRVSTERVTD